MKGNFLAAISRIYHLLTDCNGSNSDSRNRPEADNVQRTSERQLKVGYGFSPHMPTTSVA